ncbi:MAG: WYL domain-containing protein, partial [Rhodospirillaceae bacterium]|nr:WYL domain-containing protein [Rhodospirillaceae bacterium]
MRYEKADKLLQLAMDMQAAHTGLSLGDIQEKCRVGRRTAQRMRDAIFRVFPCAVEVKTDERTKRWRIPNSVMDPLIAFSADELADLETAISLLKRENLDDKAVNLGVLVTKIRALLKPEVARRIDPDLDALLEAEGLAM